MYFDDLKIGMTVDTAPAMIEKEKMLSFARDYDNIPLHTDENMQINIPPYNGGYFIVNRLIS